MKYVKIAIATENASTSAKSAAVLCQSKQRLKGQVAQKVNGVITHGYK
jgi:hypothetical protein